MTPPVLSQEAIARLEAELGELIAERARLRLLGADAERSGDAADQALFAERDMAVEQIDERLRRLQAKLADARPARPATTAGPQDAVAPGVRVLLRFDTAAEPEPFLLGDIDERDGRASVVTMTSPLGQALLGARSGATVTYRSPRGTRSVEVVDVA